MPIPLPPVDPAWAVALAYLPLIRRVAREFRRGPFDTDDLIQEGLIAVHRAIAKNDPVRDSFGGLANAAAHNRMVDWLRWLRCYGKARPMSPDAAPIGDRTDRDDLIDLADALAAIESLTDRQRSVIDGYFGLRGPRRTESQIGIALGISRDAVARLRIRGLARLRKRLTSAVCRVAGRRPCAICGDPDGIIPRGYRSPERLSLARFGLTGTACRTCYLRLYSRQRAGQSPNPDVRRLPRGRKRLGVAS
jgi:RNA polymerase sigma factor (sigma-70 family)